MTALSPEEINRARDIWEKAKWVDTHEESWAIIAAAIREAENAKLEEAMACAQVFVDMASPGGCSHTAAVDIRDVISALKSQG